MTEAEDIHSPPGETLLEAMENLRAMDMHPDTRQLVERALSAQRNIWTPERMQLARDTCATFAGTRHANRLCLPGEGVDCIHFVLAVITAAGIVPPGIRLPAYDERLGIFRERNVIEDVLLAHLHSEPATAPEFGDIVICNCGRQTNHVGIIVDGKFWHVPAKGRCGPEDVAHWMPRIQGFVRITGLGVKSDPAELNASDLSVASPPPVD